MFEFTLIYYLF